MPPAPPPTAPPPSPLALLGILTGLAALAAAAALTLVTLGRSPPTPNPITPSAAALLVPEGVDLIVSDFTLTDQDGRPATADLLDGRHTFVDFFFTNCPFVCPGMGAVMNDIQRRTAGTGLRLLSISVDGTRDDTATIANYAERLGADPRRWTFLTGDPREVGRIVREDFQRPLETDDDTRISLADGTSMANIEHPSRIFLVGPDRRVIASASFAIAQEVDDLIKLAVQRGAGD